MTGDPLKSFPAPMLLFGCGNMAGAMVAGWMAAGVRGEYFVIVKPTSHNLPVGAAYFARAADVQRKYNTLLIGIKPQMLGEMAAEIRSLLAPGALVISILGGVGTDRLARHFPGARILRIMPNLAVSIGKSPLGLFARGLSEADKAAAESWLATLGTSYWMKDEASMHGFTALAGCGPAYLYRFIGAMADGAAKLGLDPAQAAKLAKEMVEGASLLAAQSGDSPDQLAAKVASKGGSTAAGLIVLDKEAALTKLVADTLQAAHDRSVQQAEEAE